MRTCAFFHEFPFPFFACLFPRGASKSFRKAAALFFIGSLKRNFYLQSARRHAALFFRRLRKTCRKYGRFFFSGESDSFIYRKVLKVPNVSPRTGIRDLCAQRRDRPTVSSRRRSLQFLSARKRRRKDVLLPAPKKSVFLLADNRKTRQASFCTRR